MALLRADLLQGRRIVLAGGPKQELAEALIGRAAEVEPLPPEALPGDEERVGEWARAHGPLHGLVYAAGATFGPGGDAALTRTLDEAWAVVREVAVGALIEAGRPGKLVLLAPPSDAGPMADAAAAGLENLARTLSVEWARHQLTAVMVAPGSSSPAVLASLVAFLVSGAGDYLSGCRIELGSGP